MDAELKLLRAVETTAAEVNAHVYDPGHLVELRAMAAALGDVKKARASV